MAATGHHQIAVLTRLPKTFKIADRLVGIEQCVVDALDKKRIDPGYSLTVATLTGAIGTPTMFRQLCLQFLGHTSLPALVKQLIDPRGYPSLTQATRIQVGQPEAFSNTTGCRSEEHTSELQSRPHLVCRLLLEKKNYSPRPVDKIINWFMQYPRVSIREHHRPLSTHPIFSQHGYHLRIACLIHR